MHKEAGQCYFSAKDYSKAIECFSKKDMHLEVAESLFMKGDIEQARVAYNKLGCILKEIECLDLLEKWEDIIVLMAAHR